LSKVLSIVAFLITLGIHFFRVSSELEPNTLWIDSGELSAQPGISGYELYFLEKEYFLGLSYALAIAFTVFAISRLKINRNKGFLGVFSGVSLSAALYTFGCFLIGCCGSPMAIVYAGLFGSSFFGFTKPFIFLITSLSVVLGYWRMARIPKDKCCSVESFNQEEGIRNDGKS
jgi:hypothetical protein